jgi:hypothetical protein
MLFCYFLYRCQCNGHATHCLERKSTDDEEISPLAETMSSTTMICLCQHGTDGPNCETCLPDHWDRPWRRATSQKANECKGEFHYMFHLPTEAI